MMADMKQELPVGVSNGFLASSSYDRKRGLDSGALQSKCSVECCVGWSSLVGELCVYIKLCLHC